MKYQRCILIFCFEVMLAAPVLVQAQTPAASTPKEQAQAPAEDPRPVLSVPPGYRYEVRGRRDPFVNPVPKPPAPPPAEVKPSRPPGMKGALLAEVALLGVVVSRDEPSLSRAVLQIPGMRAPVNAARGDVLYDAVVKEIRSDSVVFTLVAPDKPRNPSEERDVVKKLRSTAGDKK